MITERPFNLETDLPVLTAALATDHFHRGTTPDFFLVEKTICNTYSDEDGSPILFLRGAKALRLDVLFVSDDEQRNRAAIESLTNLVLRARDNGFVELILRTESPVLAALATEYGFVASDGELRRSL